MQTCANKSAPVYLVGDSHANSLAKPLRALIREQGYELVSWTENACLPIAGLAMHPLKVAKSCNAYRQEVFQRIRERPGPVIFSARWRMHLTGEGFDNGEGGHESPPAEHISLPGQPSSAIPAHVARELRALAAQVPLMIVVDQIPEAGWDVPNALGRRHLWSGSSVPLSTSREAFVAQNAVVRGMINSLGSSIAVVRPDALVCDTRSQRCANERGGRPLYRDDDHPSEEFAGMIAR